VHFKKKMMMGLKGLEKKIILKTKNLSQNKTFQELQQFKEPQYFPRFLEEKALQKYGIVSICCCISMIKGFS